MTADDLEDNVKRLLEQMEETDGMNSVKQKDDRRRRPWVRNGKPTIFRVPDIMREVESNAYEPSIVSLGPYHRNNSRLKAMNKQKWQYLDCFLKRNSKRCLEDYFNYVKSMEDRVRSAYAGDLKMDRKEFIKMMLLDACFVVEFLMRVNDRKGKEEVICKEQDPIFGSAWAEYYIRLDMLLLENQVPLFLLHRLLQFVDPEAANLLLKPLALKFFGSDFLPGRTKHGRNDFKTEPLDGYHHILHLLHDCIKPPPTRPRRRTEEEEEEKRLQGRGEMHSLPSSFFGKMFGFLRLEEKKEKVVDKQDTVFTPGMPATIPCARELKEAGVAIKRKKETETFLDITFENGTLEIPRIRAYNVSNYILRNLIAFEQLYPGMGTHVSNFAYLMDCLIDNPLDVALLREEGILLSTIGNNKAVATLFNGLCKRVVVKPKEGHLAGVFEKIPNHCKRRTNKWRATLHHTYFGNPWAIISVAAAIFLFLLTFIQTVLAFLTYAYP